MSRRYTDDEKTQALERLEANLGNITLTAIQTNIPVRTLRDWKRENAALVAANTLPDADSPSDLLPPSEILRRRRRETGEYTRIREILMDHLFDLTETLLDDPATAHQRMTALSRLLDRVIKLESLVDREQDNLRRKRRHAIETAEFRARYAAMHADDEL